MASAELLQRGREAYARRDWREAHASFGAASRDGELSPEAMEEFAIAAHLFGRDKECQDLFASGYRACIASGEQRSAGRMAFWMSHSLMFHGEDSQSKAWLARSKAALENCGDCSERSYPLILDGIRALIGGNQGLAEETFRIALDESRKFDDPTMVAMGGHGRGRALVALGRISEGMAALDEVMLAATTGEVSPMIVGEAYCGVLEACHDVFDVRRAREWTAALSRWCESQPDLIPYRGPCLVHRVELMRLRGDWQGALEEGKRACDWLSEPASPEGPGDAHYQMAELHRLRGAYVDAEQAYREAIRCGRRPEPGLSLLWLARGQSEAARTALRRAFDEGAGEPAIRGALLPACIDVSLAVGDLEAAREDMQELRGLARHFDAPQLQAAAEAAEGRLLVAIGDFAAALGPLRRAWTTWNSLEAPFEAARVRVQIGAAYRGIGDSGSAQLEFDAAADVFQRLGAHPELERLRELMGTQNDPTPAGLSAREAEVLVFIARGLSNKEIAAALQISGHTVARHVQNMLAKLDFTSRARLAAFAVEHGMVPGGSQE